MESYLGTLSKYRAVVGRCRHTVASTTVMRLIAAADVMPVALLEVGVAVVLEVGVVVLGVVVLEVGVVVACLCVIRTACVASTHICTST